MAKELKRFNLTLGGVGSGYGLLLDGVYDLAIRDLEAAKNKINAALAIRKPSVSVVEHPKPLGKASTPSPAAKKHGQPYRKRRRGRHRQGRNPKEKPPWE